jgi:hypothetical protein
MFHKQKKEINWGRYQIYPELDSKKSFTEFIFFGGRRQKDGKVEKKKKKLFVPENYNKVK